MHAQSYDISRKGVKVVLLLYSKCHSLMHVQPMKNPSCKAHAQKSIQKNCLLSKKERIGYEEKRNERVFIELRVIMINNNNN